MPLFPYFSSHIVPVGKKKVKLYEWSFFIKEWERKPNYFAFKMAWHLQQWECFTIKNMYAAISEKQKRW